jgi:two-component system, response regulator YesN
VYKVLLIDDEDPVHLAIRSLIDWQAMDLREPVSAYNGKEGLHCMERLHPDIAFVDMSMPLMNGIDFLSIASRNHPYCQYIVVSGYDDFQYAKAAITASAVDYLLKPIDHQELDIALRKAILRLPERVLSLEEGTPTEVVTSIRDYLDRHYDTEISMEALAEKYFFSKEYLARLFRNQYGCAIYEHVLNVRMDAARKYLMDPFLSIQDIANKVGYSNANYFGKAFKRRYGISPSEFREKNAH